MSNIQQQFEMLNIEKEELIKLFVEQGENVGKREYKRLHKELMTRLKKITAQIVKLDKENPGQIIIH